MVRNLFFVLSGVYNGYTSSAVIESMTRMVSEFEWRLNVAGEKCNSL